MDRRKKFGLALRTIRNAKGLTQEDFSDISGRTYISILERGLKSPTLEKVETLAAAMGVHPLTLLTLTYTDPVSERAVARVLDVIRREIKTVLNEV